MDYKKLALTVGTLTLLGVLGLCKPAIAAPSPAVAPIGATETDIFSGTVFINFNAGSVGPAPDGEFVQFNVIGSGLGCIPSGTGFTFGTNPADSFTKTLTFTKPAGTSAGCFHYSFAETLPVFQEETVRVDLSNSGAEVFAGNTSKTAASGIQAGTFTATDGHVTYVTGCLSSKRHGCFGCKSGPTGFFKFTTQDPVNVFGQVSVSSSVPELDPSGAVAPLGLLLASMAAALEQRRRKPEQSA